MSETTITEVQQAIIDQVDATSFDSIVWDYLNNPENGFMDQKEVTVITQDATCTWVVVGVDTTNNEEILECQYLDTTATTWVDTTSTLTVEEWKETYLEDTFNDAMKTLDKIQITDSNSPNYPLIDWRNIVFDFDVTSSIDYYITPDTTADIYIEYEYPTSEKVDGMYVQTGVSGLQNYDTLTNWSFLAFYIGYSDNREDWQYIASNDTLDSTGTLTAFLTNDKDTAIANPFWVDEGTLDSDILTFVQFPDTAIEAKYWKMFMIDIEGGLIEIGEESGYTGYTASISHLRFQQYKEHGGVIAEKTMPKEKTVGKLSYGIANSFSSTSSAGWFTNTIIITYLYGSRQETFNISVRVYSDASNATDWQLQYQAYEGASWVTVDGWSTSTNTENGVSLLDARTLTNPNADVNDLWTVRYRLQDKSDTGTPNIDVRTSHIAVFRSSEE